MSQRKHRVAAATQPPKKRGNKGNFQGEPLEYLESQFPDFLATGNGRKAEFFKRVWQEFFKKFPVDGLDYDDEADKDEDSLDEDEGSMVKQTAVVQKVCFFFFSFAILTSNL